MALVDIKVNVISGEKSAEKACFKKRITEKMEHPIILGVVKSFHIASQFVHFNEKKSRY